MSKSLLILSTIAVCVALWAGSVINKAMTEAVAVMTTQIEGGY